MRLIKIEHLDHIQLELMQIKAMLEDEKARDRISELMNFIENDLFDPSRENRNEIKRDVFKKMKAAKTSEESAKWYEVYQLIDKTFR